MVTSLVVSTRGNSCPSYVVCVDLLTVCSDADLDLLWLGLLTLSHMQRQYPIAIVGSNVLRTDCIRERKAPPERTIGAFDPEVVILLYVLFELPLSTDRQRIVCDADINVLVLKVRQLGLYNQFILGFVDIYGWRPRCEVGMTRALASKVVLK